MDTVERVHIFGVSKVHITEGNIHSVEGASSMHYMIEIQTPTWPWPNGLDTHTLPRFYHSKSEVFIDYVKALKSSSSYGTQTDTHVQYENITFPHTWAVIMQNAEFYKHWEKQLGKPLMLSFQLDYFCSRIIIFSF